MVETNAHFSHGQIKPLSAGKLPISIAPMINQHIANQEMIVEAALSNDLDLAFQAFYHDPSNDLPLDTCWEFFNKMCKLNQQLQNKSRKLVNSKPVTQRLFTSIHA